MNVTVAGRMMSTLPEGDDHPYRTGAWTPNTVEYDVTDLDVIGEIPDDLEGVYLRNTENPVHDAIGRYHPFDGDGMVHMMRFSGGRATTAIASFGRSGSRQRTKRAGRCGPGYSSRPPARFAMTAGARARA